MRPVAKARYDAAKMLQRRHQAAADTSKVVIERRIAFFDRLALLDAGAVTFTATLLSSVGGRHPVIWVSVLQIGWGLLLFAIFASLGRNLSHQSFHLADAYVKVAESELELMEIKEEISKSPFESAEMVDAAERDAWKQIFDRQFAKSGRNGMIYIAAEWVACISSFLGFLCLVVFAVRNT